MRTSSLAHVMPAGLAQSGAPSGRGGAIGLCPQGLLYICPQSSSRGIVDLYMRLEDTVAQTSVSPVGTTGPARLRSGPHSRIWAGPDRRSRSCPGAALLVFKCLCWMEEPKAQTGLSRGMVSSPKPGTWAFLSLVPALRA